MPEFAECIHIQAAVIITIQLDAVHYVTPSVEFMGMYYSILTDNQQFMASYYFIIIVDHSYGLGPVENPFEVSLMHAKLS